MAQASSTAYPHLTPPARAGDLVGGVTGPMPGAPAPQRRAVLGGGLALLGAGLLTGAGASVADAATPVLRRGSTGRAVTSLQRDLAAQGYWCGTADGAFGHLTQQAAYAVQKRHGLVRDGIVGAYTRSALASGNRLKPVGGKGSRVEVHLAKQLLIVVRDGGTVMTLNTATGNNEYYWLNGRRYRATTPTGTYSVYSTWSRGWQPGPLGSLYRPMYFTGGIAVHGAGDIPPWPASHGCCRVSTAAMDQLWSSGSMAMGTRVLVV